MMHECPHCGREMDRQDEEPDVNIAGLWICHLCDHAEPIDYDESDL